MRSHPLRVVVLLLAAFANIGCSHAVRSPAASPSGTELHASAPPKADPADEAGNAPQPDARVAADAGTASLLDGGFEQPLTGLGVATQPTVVFRSAQELPLDLRAQLPQGFDFGRWMIAVPRADLAAHAGTRPPRFVIIRPVDANLVEWRPGSGPQFTWSISRGMIRIHENRPPPECPVCRGISDPNDRLDVPMEKAPAAGRRAFILPQHDGPVVLSIPVPPMPCPPCLAP